MPSSANWRSAAIKTLVTFLVAALVIPLAILTIGSLANARSPQNPAGAAMTPMRGLDIGGGTVTVIAAEDGSTYNGDELARVISRRLADVDRQDVDVVNTDGVVSVGVAGVNDPNVTTLAAGKGEVALRPVLAIDWGFPWDTGAPAEDEATEEDATEAGDEGTEGDETAGGDEAAEDIEAAPAEPTNPSDPAWVTPELQTKFDELNCLEDTLMVDFVDDPVLPLVTCSTDRMTKFILGPVEIDSDSVTGARPISMPVQQADGQIVQGWGLGLDFTEEGSQALQAMTTRLAMDGADTASNQMAIAVDGMVLEAPAITQPIADDSMIFAGNMSELGARLFSTQINNPLPVAVIGTAGDVGATLGASTMTAALIAFIVGLLLVIAFLIWQYGVLGLVALGALLVSATITYVFYALLSWWGATRITLPVLVGFLFGAALIVGSVVTYIGRLRASLRNGRTVSYAVDSAWGPTLRTLLVANIGILLASLLGAWIAHSPMADFFTAVLILTAINLMVTAWFVRPVMQLLTAKPFFAEGRPGSGLHVLEGADETSDKERRKAEKAAAAIKNELRSH